MPGLHKELKATRQTARLSSVVTLIINKDNIEMVNHSYEEIRNAALDILAGRESTHYGPTQFENFKTGVAEVLVRREGQAQPAPNVRLSPADCEIFREVFWDFFRQGIITLGSNDANPQYPHFRVSLYGNKLIEGHNTYFFHDISSYTKLINDNISSIDSITLLYLQEAMQAFKAGCILSSTVMLGVATEHTFLLLLEDIEKNDSYHSVFKAVFKQKSILQKVNKFKNILDQKIKDFPSAIKEDIDTNFAGILSIIRNFRNQSGHPTGNIIDREQTYVLLQLFVPYCKKMYQLREFFKTSSPKS